MNARVAVITGASKGIGAALAREFQRRDWHVIAVSRTQPDDPGLQWIEADITVPADRRALAQEIRSTAGRTDVLVNNAGRGLFATWEEMDIQDLQSLFELNLIAHVHMTQLFLDMLRESRGAVINTSSVAGKLAVPCMGAYCATKYALNAFSDSLRIELAPSGIHVLNLIVGRIDTGFSRQALGDRQPPETPGKAPADALA